jgi:short-subunit dehydrogenase
MTKQVILITGASSGIGAELAKQFSADGAKVVLVARSQDKLHQVASECPGETLVVPTDITDLEACKMMVAQAVERFGKLDVLVNNAGISMRAPFEAVQDLSIFEKLIEVNYLGSVYATHAALPHLKASKGQIVAISSLAGKTGVPFRSGYAASKHAVQGFFDTLRIELAGSGVDVTIISPSFVNTDRSGVLGADGQPVGEAANQRRNLMPVEEAAAQIKAAIESRRRELLMGKMSKLLMLGKLIAPGLVDQIARKRAGWTQNGT